MAGSLDGGLLCSTPEEVKGLVNPLTVLFPHGGMAASAPG